MESAFGDKATQYDNDAMKRFRDLTNKKKKSCPQFMDRFLASQATKEKKAAKSVEKLENIRKVCFVGAIGESLPHPVADGQGLTEVHGRNPCLHADLAVVDDLSRMLDCPDDATINQVLYIVGRGVPVITRASWVLARGDPKHVPRQSVIRHVSLVAEKAKMVFMYDEHFQARAGSLLGSLKELSKLPKSKRKVRRSSFVSSAIGDSTIVTLSAFGGVDTLWSWIRERRRIVNAVGSKAWSLTQPIF